MFYLVHAWLLDLVEVATIGSLDMIPGAHVGLTQTPVSKLKRRKKMYALNCGRCTNAKVQLSNALSCVCGDRTLEWNPRSGQWMEGGGVSTTRRQVSGKRSRGKTVEQQTMRRDLPVAVLSAHDARRLAVSMIRLHEREQCKNKTFPR